MSLRARLVVGLVALLVALSVAGGVITYRQHEVLIEQLDERLDLTARNALLLTRLSRRTGTDRPIVGELYVGVYSDGTLRTVLQPSGDPELEPVLTDGFSARSDRHATVSTQGGDSDRMRILVRQIKGNVVVFGLPMASTDAAFRSLWQTIVAAGVAVVVLLALVAWWVQRLGLGPIRAMTRTADAILAGDVEQRAPSYPSGTEAGRLGDALNSMIDSNQRSEARLRRFVADASHELRTPLTTLRGYVRLFEQGGLQEDGELVDAMRRMSREAHRMGLMVDDLLLLAQLDEGRPFDHEPVDIARVLDDFANDVRVVQPERTVTLDVVGDLTVVGDEARLAQAVGALVSNAWRHTPEDRAITLGGRRVGDRVRIEIVDRGDGIPADHLTHLFDRFYRVDPSRSRDKGGSGLGLSIVAAIVTAHGGTYGVESTMGRGSTFWVEIPSAASAAPLGRGRDGL